MDALQAAIDAIDVLIGRLEKGELVVSGPAPEASAQPATAESAPAAKPVTKQKAPKAPAAKPAAPAKVAAAPSEGSAGDELLSKAHLQVAKVVSVEAHPNSDKLYKCKIDIGGGQEKQVVAGLRKHIVAEELQGLHVVVVLNLKAAKLAGELSEAMILAASLHQPDGSELVRVLQPAGGAAAGEVVHCKGGSAPAEYPKVCKQWSKIVEGLAVQDGKACYEGRPLVSASGAVTPAGDMPDGAEIH